MSSVQDIQTLLLNYNSFEFHHNPALAKVMALVQNWQKQRMRQLHHNLFGLPNHQAMAQYFLQHLYAGVDFDILAKQFDKMLAKLHKIENLVPDAVIHTGVLGIELAVGAVALDLQLAQWLINAYGDAVKVDDISMRQAIIANNQQSVRKAHLQLLVQLGQKLDLYMRSFVVKTAFKMAKNKAYSKGFSPLYDFTAAGFAAMKDLNSTADFIRQFVNAELQYLADALSSTAH